MVRVASSPSRSAASHPALRRRRRRAAWTPGAAAVFGVIAAGAVIGRSAPVGAQAVLPTDFQDVLVVGNLAQPVAFDFLPDGRVLVAEQKTARVRMVVDGAIASTDPVLAVPQVNPAHGEQGLLSLAVDPDWPARPYVYVYYNFIDGLIQQVYLTRYTAAGDLSDGASGNLSLDAGSAVHLITSIPDLDGSHNGGGLRFAPDKTLLLSIGEDQARCQAQVADDFRGKIVRLKVDQLGASPGAVTLADLVPPGNPFVGQGDIAALVWALGLRNPFRFSLDPLDGTLFVADVGEDTQEEWDHVTAPGSNLGWPFYEGTFHVGFVSGCSEPGGFTPLPPLATFSHVGEPLSAIDIGVYHAPASATHPWPPLYDGDYFYTEYYQGFVVRLDRSGGAFTLAAPVPGQPTPGNWAQSLEFPAELKVGPDGSIWYVSQLTRTFGPGSLHRIEYTGSTPQATSSFGALRARYVPPAARKQP